MDGTEANKHRLTCKHLCSCIMLYPIHASSFRDFRVSLHVGWNLQLQNNAALHMAPRPLGVCVYPTYPCSPRCSEKAVALKVRLSVAPPAQRKRKGKAMGNPSLTWSPIMSLSRLSKANPGRLSLKNKLRGSLAGLQVDDRC